MRLEGIVGGIKTSAEEIRLASREIALGGIVMGVVVADPPGVEGEAMNGPGTNGAAADGLFEECDRESMA